MMKRILVILAGLVGICFLWFIIGSLGPTYLIKIQSGADRLRTVYNLWVRDGKPTDVQLERYNPSTNFYLHTNVYTIESKQYSSLLGYRSDYFTNRGELIISKLGDVIWIDHKKGPRMVRKSEDFRR